MVQIHSPRPFVWFAMPWFVYVLRSEKDGKRYFGCTQDLTERLARHHKGQVRSNRNRGPFSLLHVEKFDHGNGTLWTVLPPDGKLLVTPRKMVP